VIKGAITPLITPFTEDGELDLDTIPSLIDWQLSHGTHGISVGGSTGEPTSQSVEERIAVMRAVTSAIDGRVPFLPGTGSALMTETLALTAEAQRLGAQAALVVTPYYGRPQQEGLFNWYSTVASEFPDLPIIVYNVPVRAAVDITPATVGRLRRAHDNIVGIKETTKDFEHVSYVLDECGTDFIALSGIELLCYPMLCLGGDGHLSCVANFAPQPVAHYTTRSLPATMHVPASCITTCTRSSTPRSPRRTRCRRSGSCIAWGSCRARTPASRLRR
jgi:4-hydroxy-tetrahydrodipicolinate synthase